MSMNLEQVSTLDFSNMSKCMFNPTLPPLSVAEILSFLSPAARAILENM